MIRIGILFAFFAALLPVSSVLAQRKVVFPSKDGLTITADLYESEQSHTWIVLFHQANSSRGEYRDIAPRLNKLELNCMAVDLRSGKDKNFRVNETAFLAKEANLPHEFLDAEQDMRAAIERAYGIGKKPVIIMGSSYSASLALKLAKEMKEVKAVVAFSPGEFFGDKMNVQRTISGLLKPTYVASGATERKWVKEIISGIPEGKLIYYAPGKGGEHGVKSLMKGSEGQAEYWIQLINFLQTLKKDI